MVEIRTAHFMEDYSFYHRKFGESELDSSKVDDSPKVHFRDPGGTLHGGLLIYFTTGNLGKVNF